MEAHLEDETSQLELAILGIGIDRGEPRKINPHMREHLKNGTFPSAEDICVEIKEFEEILTKNNIQILRPDNLMGIEQIFTRDIGFVVEDYFFISNMKHKVRSYEIKGISPILKQLNKEKIIRIPNGMIIEGGDVVLWKDHIFVGLGDRTERKAMEFLKAFFPEKKVIGFELIVDQTDSKKNVLHLDCIFQPIGNDEAIIYMNGFKKRPKEILKLFPEEKLLQVNLEQKTKMFPNILSLSSSKIIIEKGFVELKIELQNRNYDVFEINYRETSKLNGLLRCSLLPLRRSL